MRRFGFCVICQVLIWPLLGCSKEKFVPVVGKVTVDGKPLHLGQISFYPDETKGNTEARIPLATIQSDGSYELVTNDRNGVRPGWYKVLIWATSNPVPARPPAGWKPNWLIDPKYTDKAKTDLSVEVIEEPEPGRYDFNLSK